MNNALFIAHFLNALLMIVLPIGLGIFLAQRFRLGWRIWWIGAGTFVLSQVGHIPFNIGIGLLLKDTGLLSTTTGWKFVFAVVFLGLSSGMFEEWARYAAYRWWAKDARSWRKGLMLGAGHGGIEAILLGGLALLGFVNMVVARTMDLSTQVPPDQLALAQQQVSAYWSMTWYASLLGALERSFTVIFHLSASILVLQAFTRRQIRWVWLSVAWHALTNAGAVFIMQNWGMYWAEVWVALIALTSLGIIFWLRQPEPAEQPAAEPALAGQPAAAALPPAEENLENLEKTRYN